MLKRGLRNTICFLLFLLLVSCDEKRIYEETTDIDNSSWEENNILKFSFKVDDPSLSYKIFYNIRYNNQYQYYNLYVQKTLLDSTNNKINALLQGMNLFKPTTGEAFGSGLGGSFDFRILSSESFKFPYKGTYTLIVQQYMRQKSLSGIQAFGFRIEKN